MRIRCLFLMLFTVFFLSACSAKQNDNVNTTTEIIQTNYADSVDEMKSNELLSLAPPFISDSYSIIHDSEVSAIIEFNGVTQDDFANYKDECENYGFVLDGFISNEYYIASNTEGYSITVVYSNGKMMVEVDAPNNN